MEKKREGFGSRTAVIFAMAGSAIGLGNIWRFPYMVGEHGGAVFVLIYIVATILFSLPIFVAEVIIGRRSHTNARDAFVKLAPGADRNALEEKAEAVCKNLYGSFYGTSFLQRIRVYRVDELIFGEVQSGNYVSGNIAHSDKRTLDLLLAAVLLLLVSAVFNYINLNMALSAKRAREMAARRLIGASWNPCSLRCCASAYPSSWPSGGHRW